MIDPNIRHRIGVIVVIRSAAVLPRVIELVLIELVMEGGYRQLVVA
jgi:hypothetical protein